MNVNLKLLYLILPAFLFVAGCSDDDDDSPVTPAANEAEMLVEAMEGADGGYLNTSCPAIVKADEVYSDVTGQQNYYLIDVRGETDYTAGHVAGAQNVSIPNVLAHVQGINAASYDKIVIICYTGQSAAWTTAMLRLSGYDNVYSMKYGMSSWHDDFDKITTNSSNQYAGDFVTTDFAKPAAGNYPTLTTGLSSGQAILEAQIAKIYAEGFGSSAIDASTVMSDPSQYFIVNYWPAAHYTSMGHINGAMQYTPKVDLKSDAFLKTLPTDKTVVVYCYTGQTSANVAFILRVMGYDAKSLKFGTNCMIHDEMAAASLTAFGPADIKNFPYE